MKRLVHINEAVERSAPRRAGLGAAIAVAGLMGAAGCATTQAVPRYSLVYGEPAPMTDFGMNFSAVRLREPLSAMTGRDARYWVEVNENGVYTSLMTVTGPNVEGFVAAAVRENNGRWHFSNVIDRLATWVRTWRGADTPISPETQIIGENGIRMMDADQFIGIIRRVSGREVARMKPISEQVSGLCIDGLGRTPAIYYRIHFLPLDANANLIGQYRGGQLVFTSSYSPGCPEMGSLMGMTMLVEPGAEDPRNVQP